MNAEDVEDSPRTPRKTPRPLRFKNHFQEDSKLMLSFCG